MMERTVAILKPDVVANGHTGEVLAMIEMEGFKIVALRMAEMTREFAQRFYSSLDSNAPWYGAHIRFMTGGPCVFLLLERENAVQAFRQLIGSTDPQRATTGTIRATFGKGLPDNAIHGSDSPSSAATEAMLCHLTVEPGKLL